MHSNAFESFAPLILGAYRRNPEAFWDAVMSPFLNRNRWLELIKHSRLSIELIGLFHKVHKEAMVKLKVYGSNDGLDIVSWQSFKVKEEYFTDAYPIYAFLVIWMHENKLDPILEKFDGILDAVVHGIAGYGILDVLVDGSYFSPVELLEAQSLIADYETKILEVFGITPVNHRILHDIRSQFLKAEIKEKSLRFKASPYEWENPVACGYKAAHLLTPFMLSLERLGRSKDIETYFSVFFLFGAVIQIIDDLKDLEEDLKIGHYAYITLKTTIPEQLKNGSTPSQAAQTLLNDKHHLTVIRDICKDLIVQSETKLAQLNDPFLLRIVHITRLRMESTFTKALGVAS